jgi:hypothetical protein
VVDEAVAGAEVVPPSLEPELDPEGSDDEDEVEDAPPPVEDEPDRASFL